MKITRLLLVVLISLNGAHFPTASAQVRRPFTVTDDIELTHFDVALDPARAIQFSPDGSYFVVQSTRGRLDLNRCENSLRFYHSEEVKSFLNTPDGTPAPAPAWVVAFLTYKECPVIQNWRWLSDSSGVAFLQRVKEDTQRLVLANLRNRTVEQLSSDTDAVMDFDIRDRSHFVYTVVDPPDRQKTWAERDQPSIVATGRDFYHLFFPSSPLTVKITAHRTDLWAVVDGKRFQVKNDRIPLAFVAGALALSPDGRTAVTMLPVMDVPLSWETLYPPSEKYSDFRFHAGHQDIDSFDLPVREYVRIALQSGEVRPLIDAPSSTNAVGWWTIGDPSWSWDGDAILLPGTFLPPKGHEPSRPCVVVVDLLSDTSTCVMRLRDQSSALSMHFVGGSRHRVSLTSYETKSLEVKEFQQNPTGGWIRLEQSTESPAAPISELLVTVKEALNEPQQVVATYNRVSRVILDPNPQLKNLEMGTAEVYTWKDKTGRAWRGGLYQPSHNEYGERYPLVIQTHGFVESRYIPSGSFQTGFAARAFAAHGIAVLQVGDDQCSTSGPAEIPCAVAGYEAAVNQLVAQGLIDPERVGIIGFSHSCLWTIGALTTNSSLRFRAALITDGIIADYGQYLISNNNMMRYFDKLIGARPIGQGLQTWLERSPGFNLERVAAPLMVVGAGPESLLSMWQPYAVLHMIKKPVELVMLNTTEHDLSNPAVRLASQGGSVDWFRFWLQGYEDPDPAKAEQYNGWRKLRKANEDERFLATPQDAPN